MQNPHAQNPHGQSPHAQAQDQSEDAPDLPAGTLEVTIADADDQALGGREVRLEILSQKISEGEQRSTKRAKTDAEGRVRFTGLATTNDKNAHHKSAPGMTVSRCKRRKLAIGISTDQGNNPNAIGKNKRSKVYSGSAASSHTLPNHGHGS